MRTLLTIATTDLRVFLVFILKVLAVIILFIALHWIFNYHRIQIDGIDAEIFCLMHGEDTRYSEDFSHKQFRKIKLGLTDKQVTELLGNPLRKFSYIGSDPNSNELQSGRFVGYLYSESPNSENYRVRVIHIDKGLVKNIIGKVWVD